MTPGRRNAGLDEAIMNAGFGMRKTGYRRRNRHATARAGRSGANRVPFAADPAPGYMRSAGAAMAERNARGILAEAVAGAFDMPRPARPAR